MTTTKKTILFIDSENLRHYIKKIAKKNKREFLIEKFDFKKLFSIVLDSIRVDAKNYYTAKLNFNPETPKKSKSLIEKQRALKTHLENQGFTFMVSGNVRGQKVKTNGETTIVFHEKGVDVKIAVDIVAQTCDNKISTVILCSSDSDLQPAVKEAQSRGAEVLYIGFELQPNKGLMYTCNRSRLIRDSEILSLLP